MSQGQSGSKEPATASPAPSNPQSIYGYLRTDEPNEEQVSSWRAELGAFCRDNGLRLLMVFCDRGSDGSEIARPGFAGLLDVLALPESVGVVVPDLDHLSPRAEVRDALIRMAKRTGAELIVISGQDAATAVEPGVRVVADERHDRPSR